MQSIWTAVRNGDLTAMQSWIERGRRRGYPSSVTLYRRDQILGAMPLHFAAEFGHLSVVTALLPYWTTGLLDYDVDAGDVSGVTALHLACANGHAAVVFKLLEHGAKIDVRDSRGNTALHWLATTSRVDLVASLLNNGASFDRGNDKGWTSLMLATVNGQSEVAQSLLDRGAQANAVNADGDSPLHLACKAKQFESMAMLERYQPNYELEHNDGLTPRRLAEGIHSV